MIYKWAIIRVSTDCTPPDKTFNVRFLTFCSAILPPPDAPSECVLTAPWDTTQVLMFFGAESHSFQSSALSSPQHSEEANTLLTYLKLFINNSSDKYSSQLALHTARWGLKKNSPQQKVRKHYPCSPQESLI